MIPRSSDKDKTGFVNYSSDLMDPDRYSYALSPALICNVPSQLYNFIDKSSSVGFTKQHGHMSVSNMNKNKTKPNI